MWIGTFGGGLDALNVRTGKSMNYVKSPQNQESLSNNKIWNLFEDNAGTIWIFDFEGLEFLQQDSGKILTHINRIR